MYHKRKCDTFTHFLFYSTFPSVHVINESVVKLSET